MQNRMEKRRPDLMPRSFPQPLWWWRMGLLALVLGALCVPAWRRQVRQRCLRSRLLPPLPHRIDDRGQGVLTRRCRVSRVTPRARRWGRAVEWVEGLPQPARPDRVAWLLSLSDSGASYFLEGDDPRRRPRLRHLHRLGGGGPAAVSSAWPQTLTLVVSPRCRLVPRRGIRANCWSYPVRTA